MTSDGPTPRVAVAFWRDGGHYPRARVRGDGDPYLRAATVMVATLQRFAPDVDVELHSNLDADDPELAGLRSLGVSIVATPFEHRMPEGYFHKFSASTYSLDVLAALAASSRPDQVTLLVDPDLVWLRDPSGLFSHAARTGLVGYPIDLPADLLDLGTTRRRLSELTVEMTGRRLETPDGLVTYLGGELLGGTGRELERFAAECSTLWEASLARFAAGTPPWLNTEEHVYSAAFHALGYSQDHTTKEVRRMWTRPGRLRNVGPRDDEKTAWHALCEKGRGLDRLHREHLAARGAFEDGIGDDEFRRRVGDALWVTPTPLRRLDFVFNRLYARVRGRRVVAMPA